MRTRRLAGSPIKTVILEHSMNSSIVVVPVDVGLDLLSGRELGKSFVNKKL